MSIIKIYLASLAVNTVQSAVIDIPRNGIIHGFSLGITVVSNPTPATGENVLGELTFNSAASFGVNDARGAVCTVSQSLIFVDAARIVPGGVDSCFNHASNIKVTAGERIYLLGQASASDIVWTLAAYLYINDGVDAGAQVRRR